MIFDVASVLALLVVGCSVLVILREKFDRGEYSLLWLSLLGHVASVFGQVWITTFYYGGGDMLNYQEYGTQVADAMVYDPATFVPLNLRLLLQDPDVMFPFFVLGAGASTGSIVAVTAFVSVFDGGSIYGTTMLFALWSFFGKLALYHAFRVRVAKEVRSRVLVGVLLIPSVVFWSSGILKESLAIGALGLMVLGLHYFVSRAKARGVILVALGGAITALFKPYILFPFVVAAGVWYMIQRLQSRGQPLVVKPVYFVVGVLVAVGGVIALGTLFPRYSLENLGEEAARQQEIGARFTGGSQYSLGDPTQRTLQGQLVYAPVALFTSLFRPLAFEARNVLMALNAVETTVLMLYALRFLLRESLAKAAARIRNSALLMFCATFVVTLGIAVGLATTNLGTLSRYRMPLVPFFATLLLVVTARSFEPVMVRAQPPPA